MERTEAKYERNGGVVRDVDEAKRRVAGPRDHPRENRAFFEEHDVLLTVSASIPPFPNSQPEVLEINGQPLRHIIDYLTITFAISVVGVPALSIPCGRTSAGLPVGMQLIGPPMSEPRLFAFADLLERELEFRHEFPAGMP